MYLQSYLPLTICFNNWCLSGPYLGKYKGDWNETLCIGRWQFEEGQCTRTIILSCILHSYLPITINCFHNGCLSGPYLVKYKRDWNETWFIDRWQWEEGQWTINPTVYITELSPHNHFFHNGCLSLPYLVKY